MTADLKWSLSYTDSLHGLPALRQVQPPVLEFEAFPKIPRYRRSVVITEKIDGSNGAIIIQPDHSTYDLGSFPDNHVIDPATGQGYLVAAQSRNRIITPDDDNFGFARWVADNAVALVKHLGPGRHFGEWWGKGIQRGYGLTHRRFSLFNTARWPDHPMDYPWEEDIPQLGVVPVLLKSPTLTDDDIDGALGYLRDNGSEAAPGWDKPEGIVVYHTASRSQFKILLENDDTPKGNQ